MSRLAKILRRTLIGIIASVFALAAVIFVVLRFYEDEVVAYVVDRIGQNLTTKAQVGEVDLSFWTTFPYASIHFNEVFIQSPGENPEDTLLSARDIYLGLSLSDLFRKNYTIRHLEVNDAAGNLVVRADGSKNWDIWKNSGDSTALNLDIQSAECTNCNVVYEDRTSRLFIDANARKSYISLAIRNDITSIDADINGQLNNLISGEQVFDTRHTIELRAALTYLSSTSTFLIEETNAKIDAMSITATGEVRTGESGLLDLKFATTNATLSELLSLAPARMSAAFRIYDPEGKISLNASVKGPYSGKNKPLIEAAISVNNGSLRHQESGAAMEKIEGTLTYSSKDDGTIRITDIHSEIGTGNIRAKGIISHLSRPSLELNLEADADFRKVKDFLGWDTLQMCEGQLSLQATVTGILNTQEDQASFGLSGLEIAGSATLSGGELQLQNSQRRFSALSGILLFNGESASLQGFKGNVNGSDFELNGTALNLVPYLFSEGAELKIDASMKSRLIDFNGLIEPNPAKSTNAFAIPSSIRLVFRTEVDRFIYRTFNATQINGVTTISNGSVQINPVSFKVAGGNVMARVSLQPFQGGGYLLESSASLQDIQIDKLFLAFDNFGQTFITNSHLRGKADSEIVFRSPLTPTLDTEQDKLYSLIDIHIEQGELIRLHSLQGIAGYIEDNKLIAPFVNEERFAEKLSYIRFSTLENTIRIEDGVIHIPEMDIRSSAMDITASGTHGFDKRIDYLIGFRLRDILLRKEKLTDEADDGLGKQMFIYMRGTSDNPQFGLHKDASRQLHREEIAEEKRNVKALLKQELGLFRNDPNVGTFVPEKEEPNGATMTIEWEDGPSSPPAPVNQKEAPAAASQEKKTTTESPSAPKKKLPKWLREKEEYEKD
jgi:uncharacterized protein involved in outer membrane biogenesis